MAGDRHRRAPALREATMKANIAAIAAMLLAPMMVQAQDSGPSGQAMAQTCYVCHGPDGRSVAAIPSLMRGQKEFVVRQMLEFKADRRPATVMNRIAKGYSDDQIAAIADYLASLK
jgi:cytochrome subunit of sulfide dehydrogenase